MVDLFQFERGAILVLIVLNQLFVNWKLIAAEDGVIGLFQVALMIYFVWVGTVNSVSI